MMYGYPYNPTLQYQARLQQMQQYQPQYQPMQQQYQPIPIPQQQYPQTQQQPNVLKCRVVSSVEEARAAQIEFDGSVFYFPSPSENKVYLKGMGFPHSFVKPKGEPTWLSLYAMLFFIFLPFF